MKKRSSVDVGKAFVALAAISAATYVVTAAAGGLTRGMLVAGSGGRRDSLDQIVIWSTSGWPIYMWVLTIPLFFFGAKARLPLAILWPAYHIGRFLIQFGSVVAAQGKNPILFLWDSIPIYLAMPVAVYGAWYLYTLALKHWSDHLSPFRPVAAPARAHSQKGAFTLVELLVVVAIIAILAALIFPVVTAAKVKSFETTDVSNMRQLYAAFLMYEEQNDGISAPTLLELEPVIKNKEVFRSPIDPIRKPVPPHTDYPTSFYFPADPRSPFRISYAYLPSWPGYEPSGDKWQAMRAKPDCGLIAFAMYGTEVPGSGPIGGEAEWGPMTDGPILRVNMDGSYYRFKGRLVGSITPDDLFFRR